MGRGKWRGGGGGRRCGKGEVEGGDRAGEVWEGGSGGGRCGKGEVEGEGVGRGKWREEVEGERWRGGGVGRGKCVQEQNTICETLVINWHHFSYMS